MNTKLTLRLDDSLIEFAKRYAARNGKSVSRIVADYFTSIKNEGMNEADDLSPAVNALKGLLSNTGVGKEDYRRHLEERHQ